MARLLHRLTHAAFALACGIAAAEAYATDPEAQPPRMSIARAHDKGIAASSDGTKGADFWLSQNGETIGGIFMHKAEDGAGFCVSYIPITGDDPVANIETDCTERLPAFPF